MFANRETGKRKSKPGGEESWKVWRIKSQYLKYKQITSFTPTKDYSSKRQFKNYFHYGVKVIYL